MRATSSYPKAREGKGWPVISACALLEMLTNRDDRSQTGLPWQQYLKAGIARL